MNYTVTECSNAELIKAAEERGKTIEFHNDTPVIKYPGWKDQSKTEMTFRLEKPWVVVDDLGRKIDPTEGMDSDRLRITLPSHLHLTKEYTVGFCQYDARTNSVEPCSPDVAVYVFVIRRRKLSLLDRLLDWTRLDLAEDCRFRYAVATGSWSVKLPWFSRAWTDCWVFSLDFLVASLNEPAFSKQILDNYRKTWSKILKINSSQSEGFVYDFYEDEMAVAWAAVIDEAGHLIEPSEVQTASNGPGYTESTQAEERRWREIRTTWMIVAYYRRSISIESEYFFIRRPRKITTEMSDRLVILEAKIRQHEQEKYKWLFSQGAFAELATGETWLTQLYNERKEK